jgi:YgiT-type zinc finger domain-containing protein
MRLGNCLQCGSRRISRVRETIVLGRRRVRVPDVPFERCANCGETFFDRESNQAIDRRRARRGRSGATK